MIKEWVDDEYDPYLPSFWDKDLVVIEKNNAGAPQVEILDSFWQTCYLPDQATATHSFLIETAEVQNMVIDISTMATSADITAAIDAQVPDGYTGSRRRLLERFDNN